MEWVWLLKIHNDSFGDDPSFFTFQTRRQAVEWPQDYWRQAGERCGHDLWQMPADESQW
jgi:hypothetical protein